MRLPVLREARLWVDGAQAHPAHQPRDPLPVDRVAFGPEPPGHLRTTVERGARVLLVDQTHEDEVLGALSLWDVIQRGTGQPEKLALARDRDRTMLWLDERPHRANGPSRFFF